MPWFSVNGKRAKCPIALIMVHLIVILIALVTRVLMDALRQKRQLEAAALGKTVERGTQTEFNPVNQITVPRNVYCSPGGECYHTS